MTLINTFAAKERLATIRSDAAALEARLSTLQRVHRERRQLEAQGEPYPTAQETIREIESITKEINDLNEAAARIALSMEDAA